MKYFEIDVQPTKKSYEQIFCIELNATWKGPFEILPTITLLEKDIFIFRKIGLRGKIKAPPSRQNHKVSYPKRKEEGPLQYSIYCIVNSGFFKSKGNLIASVARGFLHLYNKIASDSVKVKYLDYWEDSGEKLVILNGINHKHLQYLAKELYFATVGIHSYYKTWSRNKVLLVLSILGREEDFEDLLEGLPELR
ncbi:uncharacterized protein LOC131664305 [Phymastichus coffea]|uniref:uncharacterized protein LOC131664305 n=1 Tax=Phymastichus coffea TaxID=108790 RepID=UPI00273AAC6A|nr:uncharacterized protein LOC131664305 [Phymastichus coffea]